MDTSDMLWSIRKARPEELDARLEICDEAVMWLKAVLERSI